VIIELWKDQSSFDAHEKGGPRAVSIEAESHHNSPYDQRVHQGLPLIPGVARCAGTVSVVTHVDVPPRAKIKRRPGLKRVAEESRKTKAICVMTSSATALGRPFHGFRILERSHAFESHETQAAHRQSRALAPMLGAPYDERLYTPQ